MIMNDPALLELFTQLRKSGISLGIAEYHLLLQAIEGGFGTGDREALAQLCRTLWIKSPAEEKIFQNYFDQLIPLQPEPFLVEEETEKNRFLIEGRKKTLEKEPKQASRVPRLIATWLGLIVSVVGIGSAVFLNRDRIVSIFSSNEQSSAGRLAFGGIPFFPLRVKESDKKIQVTIIRVGGRHGSIDATLIIEDDPYIPVTIDDTPKPIHFSGKDVKVQKISIPIVDDEQFTSTRTILIRLTDTNDGDNISSRDELLVVILDDDDPVTFPPYFREILEAGLSVIVLMILVFVVMRMRRLRQVNTLQGGSTVPETSPTLSKTTLSSEVIQTMTDGMAVAKTNGRPRTGIDERFPLAVKSLPVTRRQMKQGWRYLRQMSREGPPSELDLDATIQQVSQQGMLLSPVLISPRLNRIELLLLIDREGSMVPFHHLAQELVETAYRGGRFRRVRVYYFHNCPDEYLHRDPYYLEAELVDECLTKLPKSRTVCIIFSDAGAARGGSSSKRRRMTKFFLRDLGVHVRYTAWLNPVPRQRWANTTAHSIAELVPMFELTRQDFYQAVDVLRGRYSDREKMTR